MPARPEPTASVVLIPNRRRQLLQQVRQDGSARVDDLAAALGVSSATVRRDLATLADDGLLLRARGGAYLAQPDARGPARPTKQGDEDGKQRIGRQAAARVSDGMTIMILSGTTTAAMVPYLGQRSITVVTNGLAVAHALADLPSVELVMLGGVLHREQMTFLGPMTEQSMENLHVDIMFGGAHGIDPRVGVTGAKVLQAANHHVMLQHAQALVVLADSSKFGRQGPTLLARIDQVHSFITSTGASEPVVEALRQLGAEVEVC